MTRARMATRFACDGDFVVADLLTRLQATGTLHGPVEARADEVYFDTRSDELAAAGLSARCRELAGLRMAELVVVPIDADVLPVPPRLERALARTDDLGEVIRAWVEERFGLGLSEPPREVLSLVIVRRRWSNMIHDVRVELALDEIAASEPHGRRARLTELAIDGPEADSDGPHAGAARRVVAVLGRVEGLTAVRESTFQRTRTALGLGEFRYGAKPAPLVADDLLVDAARRVIASWWATAGAHIPGVRVDLDPEHVHKMRVAVRRLRTALRLFGDAFDPTALAALRERMKGLGRVLGEVRDLDVQRDAVDGWRERFPTIEATAWQDITARMDRLRLAARREALVLLDPGRWRELDAEVERCQAPDVRGLRHTVGAVAPELVGKRTDRCARALERAQDGGAHEAHALRIEVKNLRYSLDFLGDALADTGDIGTRLAALQETLGRVQDDVQTGELAQRLIAMPPCPPSATALALGMLVGYGRARADHAVTTAREAVAIQRFEDALAQLDALVYGGD